RLLRTPSFTHNVKQLKAVLVGGSSIPRTIIIKAHECGLPLFTTYGLTEMASQVTTTRPGDAPDRLFTSGQALEHRQVKVDRNGEILVKGDTLFRGYVADGNVSLPLDNDGWFHTGDLGSMDSDGYLTVTGRKDNMFISGGENIYPEEIEGTLSLLDGITEALVVPFEDEDFGFRPVAFIRGSGCSRVCKSDLVDSLEKVLPRFKIPVCFYQWPESGEKPQIKPSRPYFQELLKRGELIEIT
ncbi:MAG: AMP-binding protein, partial [Candidatus Zixiibacteriota bacterium]